MKSSIIFEAGPIAVKFYVAPNASKTFDEFKEHERHIGLTESQLKEAFDAIKAEAGVKPDLKKKRPDEPVFNK
jgi:hypothetical protein